MIPDSINRVSIPHLNNPVTIVALGFTAEDNRSLREICRETGWGVVECAELREAAPLLDAHNVRVLLCSERFENAGWQDVVELTAGRINPPTVVVVARHADETLWAEVLNLGAFDLLESPLDRGETVRVVACAWLHAKVEPRAAVQSNVNVLRATA